MRISTIVVRQLDLVRTNPPEFAPCDVVRVVESVIGLIRKQAEDQSVAFDLRVGNEIPHIEADKQVLRQAILNLRISAAEATPRRGTIGVLVESKADRLSVVVERKEGVGLGLSIAFQIIDQQGGDLWAEDQANTGARFPRQVQRAEPALGFTFPSGGVFAVRSLFLAR